MIKEVSDRVTEMIVFGGWKKNETFHTFRVLEDIACINRLEYFIETTRDLIKNWLPFMKPNASILKADQCHPSW